MMVSKPSILVVKEQNSIQGNRSSKKIKTHTRAELSASIASLIKKEVNKEGRKRLEEWIKKCIEAQIVYYNPWLDRNYFLSGDIGMRIYNIPKDYIEKLKIKSLATLIRGLLNKIQLNEGEQQIVNILLNEVLRIYLGEYRKREQFYDTGLKTPAGYHFVKVLKNVLRLRLFLDNKKNKNIEKILQAFDKNKLPILLAAIFHDVIEDKRLVLPTNEVVDNKDLLVKLPSRVSPKVLFDNTDENILNSYFVEEFKKYLDFKNSLENNKYFNFNVLIDNHYTGTGIRLKEEPLLSLNQQHLRQLLRHIFIVDGWANLTADGRELVLTDKEIELILKIVDYLTQRKHGSFYKDDKNKYQYIQNFIQRLKEGFERDDEIAKMAILVKLADFLDNISSSLSEKQKEKYSQYYVPFFKQVFGVEKFEELVPEELKNNENLAENLKELESFSK